jgi:hypothetical protein
MENRMVIPGLDKALKKAGWNAPVEFREQTGAFTFFSRPVLFLTISTNFCLKLADLIRENQFNIEKNWSPFLGENDEVRPRCPFLLVLTLTHCVASSPPSFLPFLFSLSPPEQLFFHVSLVPQQIYKYVPNLTLRPMDPAAPAHNCLTDLLGADMNRVHLHHATPLLRATLCQRGECTPDVHNTVLFGIVHVKYHPLVRLFPHFLPLPLPLERQS